MGGIDIIEIPKFVLENLYQTLQTIARIHNSCERETCIDRDITSMERVEFD